MTWPREGAMFRRLDRLGSSGFLVPPKYMAPLTARISYGNPNTPCRWWRRLTRRGHEFEAEPLTLAYRTRRADTNEWESIAVAFEGQKCRHCPMRHGSAGIGTDPAGGQLDRVTVKADD